MEWTCMVSKWNKAKPAVHDSGEVRVKNGELAVTLPVICKLHQKIVQLHKTSKTIPLSIVSVDS